MFTIMHGKPRDLPCTFKSNRKSNFKSVGPQVWRPARTFLSSEQNQASSRIWIRGLAEPPPAYVRALSASITTMVLRDLIGDVLRTLWAHKLRTFLTMFGIAWGIVSIVLMVAAGEGLRKGQAEQARNLGKDILIVFHGRTSMQVGGTRAGREVRWEDADVAAVQAESPDCQYAIPELEQDDVRAHSNYNNAAFTVTGSIPRSATFAASTWAKAVSTTGTIRRKRAAWRFWERCLQAALSRPQSGGRRCLSE